LPSHYSLSVVLGFSPDKVKCSDRRTVNTSIFDKFF